MSSAFCITPADKRQLMADKAQRLRLARERAGFTSASEAAEAMGAIVSTYIGHENGSRGYSAAKAERYARFFRVSPEWLLYGKGEEPETRLTQDLPGLQVVTRYVPVLGEVQAGVFAAIADDQAEPKEGVPIHLPGFDGATLFALRCRGPSMNIYYPDGSLVIVCPAAEIGVREGDHVVVRRKQGSLYETTVKEVVMERGRLALYPRSTDPAFQEPIRLDVVRDADEGPEIIAVVVSSYNIRPVQQRPLLQI